MDEVKKALKKYIPRDPRYWYDLDSLVEELGDGSETLTYDPEVFWHIVADHTYRRLQAPQGVDELPLGVLLEENPEAWFFVSWMEGSLCAYVPVKFWMGADA